MARTRCVAGPTLAFKSAYPNHSVGLGFCFAIAGYSLCSMMAFIRLRMQTQSHHQETSPLQDMDRSSTHFAILRYPTYAASASPSRSAFSASSYVLRAVLIHERTLKLGSMRTALFSRSSARLLLLLECPLLRALLLLLAIPENDAAICAESTS